MANGSDQSIKGDRALTTGDQDRLGFREVAKRIALSLVDRATEDGLVIGLEGPWGSGKSSLLFLIGDELERLSAARKPTIINFRPWLIGNRDALISNLFSELSRQLDQVALNAGDATRTSVAKAKKASEALRIFVNGLSKSGAAVELVGKTAGFAPIEWFGKALTAAGKAVEGKPASAPLSKLKETLAQSLRELDHRFVVLIDDVDRLEPTEVIEILRLVRSVVDLPNIIYLLCYDSSILAHSIEKAAGVASGRSYLEKIVQLTVMVPKPEPLQLRGWFSDELQQIASTKNEDERSRLGIVIDYEGGRQLRTPRSVVRALDAVRFFWPPLAEIQADLADLVWLQLIKDGNAALYRWIEDYCATSAVISLGTARVEDTERKRKLAELFASAEKGYFDDLMYRNYFAEQLLGMEVDYAKDGSGLQIFSGVTERQRDKAIHDKRLASPDHFRLYFALANPSHVLKQEEFASIWTAAEVGAEPLGKVLLHLSGSVASGRLTKADLLLDRVKGGAYEVLSPVQCENLLIAFSHVMDPAYRERPFDLYWIGTLWDRARSLIPLLLSRIDPPRRQNVIGKVFGEGSSIGWLTSLLRHETFAHGRYGEQRRPKAEWLFTDEQLDQISGFMIGRYKAMSATEVLSSPDPISLLFAWLQAGDKETPRQLIQENITSDQGLIETLEALVSTIHSSDRGRFHVLKRANLAPFMNFDQARTRINDLRNHNDLSNRAKNIAKIFDDGDHY